MTTDRQLINANLNALLELAELHGCSLDALSVKVVADAMSSLRAELDAARAREQAWQARAWGQERSAAEESFRADAAEARAATLREALNTVVNHVCDDDSECDDMGCTALAVARAALAAGDDTRG